MNNLGLTWVLLNFLICCLVLAEAFGLECLTKVFLSLKVLAKQLPFYIPEFHSEDSSQAQGIHKLFSIIAKSIQWSKRTNWSSDWLVGIYSVKLIISSFSFGVGSVYHTCPDYSYDALLIYHATKGITNKWE